MPVRINILNRSLAEQHPCTEQPRTEKAPQKNLFCCHEIVSRNVFGIGLKDQSANYISQNFVFVKFSEGLAEARLLVSIPFSSGPLLAAAAMGRCRGGFWGRTRV
jgi:hypothetical protein